MDYDKRKRTRQCPDSDISDFDDSTQPPTTSNDTPQHFFSWKQIREETNNIFVPVFNTKSDTKYSW